MAQNTNINFSDIYNHDNCYYNINTAELSTDEIVELLGEELLMMTHNTHMVKEAHWLVCVKSGKTFTSPILRDALVMAFNSYNAPSFINR